MPIGRVAVVGGSITGCAFALAAARGGAEVTVYERTTGELADRGVGIALHVDRYVELEAAGYVDDTTPWRDVVGRKWLVDDGGSARGRLLWDQSAAFRVYNWGQLWQGLRRRVPAEVDYRGGTPVTLGADGDVVLPDGTRERYDVVVGADGYGSAVRTALFPAAVPQYAGYAMWRGSVPWEHEPIDHLVSICIPNGQGVMYRIPSGTGDRMSWGLYSAVGGTADPRPGLLALVRKYFPPFWADLVTATPESETLIQPINDLVVDAYTSGRTLVAGDAAAIARPHVASGAVKGIQDAVAFESACLAVGPDGSWDDVLARYQADRYPAGADLVRVARAMGYAMVEDTPDWTTMTPERMVDWWAAQHADDGFGGHALGASIGTR
ncbi:FAD-dependent monooxygenase [Embleya sp. NBC_00888]|uniref:FAD-dependent monooxygenase n=1 Tax=Embleya sp. NBC_00888 TaxID=2975960 RepID=UPI003868E06F|nr:FAD-dependent monooxygenase [Embleya sp. NBC_00888]